MRLQIKAQNPQSDRSNSEFAPSRPHQRNDIPASVHQVLQSSGQSFDTSTRTFMESRFGHDFSGVRIHTDSHAEQSARAINALAYAAGPHLAFARGQYAPQTPEGLGLIAHELTHTIQQSQTPSDHLAIRNDPSAEREADQNSARVLGHAPLLAARHSQSSGIARFSDTGHHILEEAALGGAGFSTKEIGAIEKGNIQRDYSQVGTVGNTLLLCQPNNFGGYQPQEHFDNSIWDEKSGRWRTRGVGKTFKYDDPNAADASPIDYIENQLSTLARAGMNEQSLVHLGNAFHTVEDFFAHSNFLELTQKDERFGRDLITGSVPPGDSSSIFNIVASVSDPSTRGFYEKQAEAATEATEPLSHAHISKDRPSSRNYSQALQLGALVIQDLGKDIRAALQAGSPEERERVLKEGVFPKIRRFLRPPNPKDPWWETLKQQDAGAIDRRIEEAEKATPETVNQCVFSPLRNLEASRNSPLKIPIGVAIPVRLGQNRIWIQGGVGVGPTQPLPLERLPVPSNDRQQPGLLVGGQITAEF
jgi:Domain of unknown function (DUF4157)/Heterokaryon incompatibility protein Het-C